MPIFALTFVDILGLTIILPLLHLYAVAYGASPLQVGLVAASFPLAQLIGVPVMGALSDRFGRKPLLLISQVTTLLSFIMLGLAQSLEVIILSRLIDGLFGANISTAQAALSDITDEKTRAQGLGLTGAAFGLGFVLGPAIALIALEITDNLAIPAFTAAVYSFISILLTLFFFTETLPPEQRSNKTSPRFNPFAGIKLIGIKGVTFLLVLIFAEQLVFFGFESLMGLFTLSHLGLLGQGNAIYFLFIGIILVTVQARYIGKWSRKYGERNLVISALVLLSIGLLLVASTPKQPHPFYVTERVEFELRKQAIASNSTEAIIGDIQIPLPSDENNGVSGVLWFLVALIPISIGAGLVRPNINSMLTKRVGKAEYGSILGLSASVVSAGNAIAPILGGLLVQNYGTTLPFLLGGVWLGGLAVLAVMVIPQKSMEKVL